MPFRRWRSDSGWRISEQLRILFVPGLAECVRPDTCRRSPTYARTPLIPAQALIHNGPMSDEPTRRPAAPAAPRKRELEQAPQLVRKAAGVLMVGALFPWLSSISTGGELPWGHWFGAIVLTLLAGGILMESAKHRAGLKANGLVKSIDEAHPMASLIAARA